MPRRLQDRYDCEITINGQPVDWDVFVLEEYSMNETVKMRYPTGELSFTAGPEYILNNPIVDGSPITISIQDTQINPPAAAQLYRMRAFNARFKPIGHLFKWYTSLKLDAKDLDEARIKSYGNTTSSNAIAAAAQDAGLTPDCDPSSDTQKWLRTNERGADFIYRVAKNAYAGANSCFITGITGLHKLRQYDLNRRLGGSTQWTFQNNVEEKNAPGANVVLYEDASYGTISGTTNSYAGYGRTGASYDILKGMDFLGGGDAMQAFSGVMNAAKDLMGSQRGMTLPYDSDNTHKNYQKAASQNLMIKAMFSTKVEVRTRFGRNVELLDYVNLIPYAMGLMDITGGLITPWAGPYFVTQIDTLVSPSAVGKQYTLLKEGMELTGNFGLLAGTAT